jgi:SAM-dependent methyltransferase
MNHSSSLPAQYFDELYAADADPWRFATSDYERDKYAATMAALPFQRFDSALEVGCSIGVLTRQLAERCDALVAVDAAQAALDQARDRCADLPHVTLRRMVIPGMWPGGTFDLILLSEVVYYLSPADIVLAAQKTRRGLRPGGIVLLVHYILPTNYPCSGDEASETFIRSAGLPVIRQQRQEAYRLDLLGG